MVIKKSQRSDAAGHCKQEVNETIEEEEEEEERISYFQKSTRHRAKILKPRRQRPQLSFKGSACCCAKWKQLFQEQHNTINR
ncbi:hypothetical protein T02_9463 [Trichinella nativa]|uniref:Uncharacterized protein n=1 Tax=Trichinella nativa TaxID=6335 RepID=A0A0V1L8Q0_9BILA|nr:hypothetical protein T02_9463 [Trichinella nativa]